MVGDLIHEGITVIWSTSYLDEAELCGEVLLMHAGRVEYNGPPQTLISRMQGRSIQLRNITGNKRKVLKKALHSPLIIDGVIQGDALRLVLKEVGQLPDLKRELTSFDAGAAAHLVEVKPSLEDMPLSTS